jgi:hypothetical protein
MLPNIFLAKLIHKYYRRKKQAQKKYFSSLIFKKLTKVNNRPNVANPPNLVTLFTAEDRESLFTVVMETYKFAS